MSACIGTPISWPRLERFAAGSRDAEIEAHLASCPACTGCLATITADTVALPPLVIAVAPARTPWWRWLVPTLGLAAAAAIALLLLRQGDERRAARMSVKGVGDVTIGVVRERADVVTHDARTFRGSDRWKVVVTCPPSASATFTVEVHDGGHVDEPLPPAELPCGNEVVLPGAFTIRGARAHRICVRVGDDRACVSVEPEP